jgi:hypothetical protein
MFIYRAKKFRWNRCKAENEKFEISKAKSFQWKFSRCLINNIFFLRKSKDSNDSLSARTTRFSRKTINHTKFKIWKLFKYLTKTKVRFYFFIPARILRCWCLCLGWSDSSIKLHESWLLGFLRSPWFMKCNVCTKYRRICENLALILASMPNI